MNNSINVSNYGVKMNPVAFKCKKEKLVTNVVEKATKAIPTKAPANTLEAMALGTGGIASTVASLNAIKSTCHYENKNATSENPLYDLQTIIDKLETGEIKVSEYRAWDDIQEKLNTPLVKEEIKNDALEYTKKFYEKNSPQNTDEYYEIVSKEIASNQREAEYGRFLNRQAPSDMPAYIARNEAQIQRFDAKNKQLISDTVDMILNNGRNDVSEDTKIILKDNLHCYSTWACFKLNPEVLDKELKKISEYDAGRFARCLDSIKRENDN